MLALQKGLAFYRRDAARNGDLFEAAPEEAPLSDAFESLRETGAPETAAAIERVLSDPL